MYLCISVCGYVDTSAGAMQRPGDVIESPGAVVTGGSEPSDTGAGYQTQVLQKGSKL